MRECEVRSCRRSFYNLQGSRFAETPITAPFAGQEKQESSELFAGDAFVGTKGCIYGSCRMNPDQVRLAYFIMRCYDGSDSTIFFPP